MKYLSIVTSWRAQLQLNNVAVKRKEMGDKKRAKIWGASANKVNELPNKQ